MSREQKALLRSGVLPLILGNGISAHLLSLRLLRRYGVPSIICGERKELLSYLNFKCGFLQLSNFENTRLASEQLTDFASDNEELTLLILPCTDKTRSFVKRSAPELESHYILFQDEKELHAHPLFARHTVPSLNEQHER